MESGYVALTAGMVILILVLFEIASLTSALTRTNEPNTLLKKRLAAEKMSFDLTTTHTPPST